MNEQSDVVNLSRYLLDHDNLSDAQRSIAEYLCENPWEGLTQTAAEIGDAVGVSASTVVRFAQSIGFDGLTDLQKLLGRHVRFMLRSKESLERLKFVNEQLGLADAKTGHDIFRSIVGSEIANLERTLHSVSPEQYEQAVAQLVTAESVYVLGLRGSLSLAVHFAVGMTYVRPNVFRLDNSGDDLPDKLVSLTPRDALVAFSYSPYTSTTVKVVRVCKSIGAHTTVITDSPKSPAGKLSDCHLVTYNPVWFSSSTGGTTALINSLVYSTAAKLKDRVGPHVEKARRLLTELESFELNSMTTLIKILGDREIDEQ